jgi:histidyl-tRNA synthetase
MKRRLARADAQGARFAIIIGDNELAKGVASLKALGPGTQSEVSLGDLVGVLKAG